MELAKTLIRITARAFYSTEHILIVDALAIHSTLTDTDLAIVLGIPQTKSVRRLCGLLREDGLISVQSRGEKKEGAPSITPRDADISSGSKDRLFYRDWYYINYHHAIDSIKYRMWRLFRHVESLGASTLEKKDLTCPRCKSSYTELEVMDNISTTGEFLCHLCQHILSPAAKDDIGENESIRRLNNQLSRIVDIMRQIDSNNVPENDFNTALSNALPIERGDHNPARKMQIIDDAKLSLASSQGLALLPEKISVSVVQDDTVVNTSSEEVAQKLADEANQNLLPEWISRSTINGDITSIGAKEATERAFREADYMGRRAEHTREQKKARTGDNDVMDAYWAELKAEQEKQAQVHRAIKEGEEESDEDDNEFEDAI